MTENAPLIACSLDAAGQLTRTSEWADLVRRAMSREQINAGLRYTFRPVDADEQRIRELAAAEQTCCPFLAFTVSRHEDVIALTVTAPAAGQEALRAIFSA